MKTKKIIFRFNLILIIINISLITIPYYALLFLMVLGVFQILFAVIIGFQFNKMSVIIKTTYLLYILLTASVLYTFFLLNNGFLDSGQQLITLCFIASFCLAFQNLFITYKLQQS
ncbi:hypothetical protein [Winogradskyella sp.]